MPKTPVKKKPAAKKKPAVKKATVAKADAYKMELPEVCDILHAESLHAECKKAAKSNKVQVDASQVNRITTPAVQLLLSLSQGTEDQKLEIENPSDVFVQAFEDLGLHETMNIWKGA